MRGTETLGLHHVYLFEVEYNLVALASIELMGCFSLFPGVACPPHGPSHQHLFISEYSWRHYYGWSWESQSRGMKAVELGWDNPNIVFTFTFEYENEIEFGKVGNENENEHAGYWEIGKRTDSIGNMSNTVGIKKTNRKHRSVEPNWALQQHNYITRQHQCTYTHTWYMIHDTLIHVHHRSNN